MSMDVYRKIAAGALAQLENRTPAVFVLTSSRQGADCRDAAERLASAFAAIAGEAAAETVSAETASAAESAVQALLERRAVTVVPLACLRDDVSAMLLASAAKNVLLYETRGCSRTDEIAETLETIQNLGARAVGFVLA